MSKTTQEPWQSSEFALKVVAWVIVVAVIVGFCQIMIEGSVTDVNAAIALLSMNETSPEKTDFLQHINMTFNVVAWIVVVMAIVGLCQITIERKRRRSEHINIAITRLTSHTDIVADYQSSPEKTEFLQHVQKITDGRRIRRRDIHKAESLFKAACMANEKL